MSWEEDCPFCALFEEGASPCWRQLFGSSEESEVLFKDGEFTVVLDTAPLVPGHLLIVPYRHTRSLAQLKARGGTECTEVKKRVSAILTVAYASPTFLEHGSESFSRNAGACVDHAHLHAIPGRFRLRDALRRDFAEVTEFASQSQALERFQNEPYLYCEEPTGEVYGAIAPMCAT
jgi:diadenosine tetraphosphate (Ap4A) HIT family hydrolase